MKQVFIPPREKSTQLQSDIAVVVLDFRLP